MNPATSIERWVPSSLCYNRASRRLFCGEKKKLGLLTPEKHFAVEKNDPQQIQ
jgi:hypothetical protein